LGENGGRFVVSSDDGGGLDMKDKHGYKK